MTFQITNQKETVHMRTLLAVLCAVLLGLTFAGSSSAAVTSLTATLLGQTGEDIVGTLTQAPDGIKDVHVRLTGLPSPLTSVKVTGVDGIGNWQTPKHANWWLVAIMPQTDPSIVDLYFDPRTPESAYTIIVNYGGVKQTLLTVTNAPPPPVWTLALSTFGTGTGTTTGAGVYANGTVVTLLATPASGSTFNGWLGVAMCATGTVTMTANTMCTANFTLISPSQWTLTIAKAGTGSGATTGAGTYVNGTVVTMTATPATGSTFGGWTGTGCTTGTVTMTANTGCTAVFTLVVSPASQWTLAIATAGTGSGATTGAGTYVNGTVVTMTAAPATGSTFGGWTGTGCTTGTVTMTANATCTAVFTLVVSPPPSTPTTISCVANPTSVQSGNWSDPATWPGGCLPGTTDHVTIPAGQTVTYDMPAGSVTEVTISGTLAFTQVKSTQLDVGSIIVLPGGALEVGTEAAPITMAITARIRLADITGATYAHIHGQIGLQPVLHAHGGRIDLHGTGPLHPWSRLAMNSAAGITTLTMADDLTGWKAGDRIIITSTRKPEIVAGCTATEPFHFGTFDTVLESVTCMDPATRQQEENVIRSVSGNTITLAAPLMYGHLGTFPRQAAVGNLTRNVIVSSLTPDARRGHVHMATSVVNSSTGVQPVSRISDAAFIQLGRAEAGVYGGPHFHMQGNAPGNYLKRSVIYDSANVWVRVHQSNFLTIQDNIGYQSRGNGFSTEDASEVFNTFDHNLGVAATKQPAASTNPNDLTDENEGSAFWLNNPRNIVTNNMAADSVYGFRYHTPVNPNKVLALADATGILQAPIDITKVEVLRDNGNTATGNIRAGLDMVGIQSMATSLIQNLTALDNRNTNLNSLSINLVVDGLYADNGGMTPPGTFSHADLGFYIGQQNLTARNSTISYFHEGYQFAGWSLIQQTSVGDIRRSCEASCEGLMVFKDIAPVTGGIHIDDPSPPPDGTTAMFAMYLMNYDGPGLHVKLIPWGSTPTDGLAYHISSRWNDGPSIGHTSQWAEASFTGPATEGPPPTFPFRIDVGNRADRTGQDLTRQDLIINGRRWRIDGFYVPSPTGYHLGGYGYDTILPPKIDPTNDQTLQVTGDGTLLGSFRSGQKFAYYLEVPNGAYWVDLGFQETFADYPSYICRAVGCRGVKVTAEGTVVFPSIDPQAEVGLNAPLWKSFPVTVADGVLTLEFEDAVGGKAMVGAIAVCPQSMIVGGRCP